MLFKVDTLEKIKAGEVTMAIRKWKRPTVKKGGTLITVAGQLKILDVEPVDLEDISAHDLKAAGIDDISVLKRSLNTITDGHLYKISFILTGPDPRIALRNNDQMTPREKDKIKDKLARMDRHGPHGPWSTKVLQLIDQHPKRRAIELASILGVKKDWLKKNIRKLKSLGLTISHRTGYEISPRGRTLLEWITKDK